MKHANSLSWETGSYKTWSGGYYEFGGETAPYSPPLSFKLQSTDGQVLTATDLVSSLTSGSGTMTEAFSSAYLYEDVDGEHSESDWTLWLALTVMAFVVIVAVLFIVMRRRRSGKTQIYFDDAKEMEVSDLAKNDGMVTNGGGSERVGNLKENESDEVESIVVEVEAHETTGT